MPLPSLPPTAPAVYKLYQAVGLLLGPSLFLLMFFSPPPAELAPQAWATAALAIWMAVWWSTEAVPLAVTALLPVALLPPLGVSNIEQAAAPYANPLIFLFLGGFLIALSIQRWNLHRRIALHIVSRAGEQPAHLIGGAMVATAGLSMWISNTATAIMMVPIAASLVAMVLEDGKQSRSVADKNFATGLMLGIAYAASIGGTATLIGSPPNALLASFMNEIYGRDVTFADWLMLGLPVSVVMLPLGWLVLTRLAFPVSNRGAAEHQHPINEMIAALGPISRPEKRVAVIAALVAAAWVLHPLFDAWLGRELLSDSGIAIFGAVLLFATPADWNQRRFLLDWQWASKAPWHILLLFGGGLSLAEAIDQSGLAGWIGGGLHLVTAGPTIALIVGVAVLVIFLTELTSNTATTAAFLPIVGALAVASDLDPIMLMAPAALAASCAFMLPVATPPNAIVFGSGHITVPQMIRAGLVMNVIGVIVISLAVWLLAPLLF